MEQRLSLVTLGVANLAEAERFYCRLGWKRGNRHAEVAFYQMPGMVLALWSREALAADANVAPHGEGFGGIVLAYNARSRTEVDEVLGDAAAAGGRVLKKAADAFWGGYSGCFADPDGHLWEVAWNPDWQIAGDGSVTLPYSAPDPNPKRGAEV